MAAPLLAEAVGYVAHTPIRNSGTVGGSLAHADPAAELPAVVLALDAELAATGPAGTRTIPAAEFLQGPFTTAMEPGEILTEVRLPAWDGGHAFVEFARTHGSFALVGVGRGDRAGRGFRIAPAAVALSGVAPTPMRATAAEQALAGAVAGDATAATAAEAAGGTHPRRGRARRARRPGSSSPAATSAGRSRWRCGAPRTGGETRGAAEVHHG